MHKHLTAMIGILLVAVIFSGAFAEQVTLTSQSAPEGWTPASGNLDETFNDSIYYHNFTNRFYYYSDAADFYSGVRFTAPANFTLQAFRFLVSRGGEFDATTVQVYSNDGGQPDELLLTILDNEAPNSITLLDDWDTPPAWIECLIDEDDYIDFEIGEDFWIVVGPVPGETNTDWSTVIDDDGAVPGDRSKTGFNDSPTNLGSTVPYDYIFHALGAYDGTFVDLVGMTCYNDIQQFQLDANTPVTFTGRFRNAGTTASEAGTVTFAVADENGDEVFSTTADLPSVAALNADTVLVTATETWTPTTTGRYIVTATAAGGEENDTENNTAYLLQQVVALGDWYVYDDGDFNVNINMSATDGYGTRFYPTSYPAQIDSATWYFGSDTEDITLVVWIIADNQYATVWELTTDVVEGWNAFEITSEDYPEGIGINDGSFVLGMYGDGSYSVDSEPPVAASNYDMPNVGMSYDGSSLYLSESGNGGMRAMISRGVAPELQFPETTVSFFGVEPGSVGEAKFLIINNGTGIGRVDSVRISPTISDVVSVDESFPFAVEADSLPHEMTFLWAPTAAGNLSGGALLYHNDPNAQNPITVMISGTNDVLEISAAVPESYFMDQNYPNPFNPTTSVRFGLKEAGHVRLTVYNVMGQEVMRVVDQQLSTGVHEAVFDASRLASGIYYYSIEVNNFTDMKKMTLVK